MACSNLRNMAIYSIKKYKTELYKLNWETKKKNQKYIYHESIISDYLKSKNKK